MKGMRGEKAAARAAYVFERRSQGATFTEIGDEMGFSPTRASQLFDKAKRNMERASLHGGLSPRAEKIIRLECNSFEGHLVARTLTRSGLERRPNCGRATIAEIERWLAGFGHALKD